LPLPLPLPLPLSLSLSCQVMSSSYRNPYPTLHHSQNTFEEAFPRPILHPNPTPAALILNRMYMRQVGKAGMALTLSVTKMKLGLLDIPCSPVCLVTFRIHGNTRKTT
jgi:hypothetical protein